MESNSSLDVYEEMVFIVKNTQNEIYFIHYLEGKNDWPESSGSNYINAVRYPKRWPNF